MSFLNAAAYFLNPFAIPVLAVSTLLLLISLFVLKQNPRSSRNVSFFIICISSCIWLYGISIVYCSRYETFALNWYKYFTFFGVTQIAPSIYFFSVSWAGWSRQRKISIVIGYLAAFSFFLSSAFTDLGIIGIRKYFWGFYPIYGPVAAAFFAFFILYYSMALRNFLLIGHRETGVRFHTQNRYMTVAYLVTFFGAFDFIPKFMNFPLYPMGYLTVLSWLMIVAYSIIRYKVMDIETVIHKTLMWAALSSVIFLPLGFVFYQFKDLFVYLHPVLSAILAVCLFILFAMYGKTIQPWIDHLFQRRKLDLERMLFQFNDSLVHVKGLSELSRYVVQTIRQALYVDPVQIFLKDSQNQNLRKIETNGNDAQSELSRNNSFIEWLEREDKLALAEFIDLDPRFESVKDQAKRFFGELNVKVIIPLVLNGELIGLIALGQKANLKAFKASELGFLSELRRAVTIAFSNSLRLIAMQENLQKWNEELEEKVQQRTKELEEAQKQLVQAEKLATIGTLAGGVAHEINNPLTAVLTNAQLLKMGTSNKDDMESISLIEEGAKRCQTIVQKLMKYARKPAAEDLAKEVDLNAVIENMVSFLNYQFEQDNIRLQKKLHPVSKVKGMPNELEQVFTNIVINAKDAIKAAKNSGAIEVETYEKNGSVCVSIKDDGIGISQANLSKIFDPFFTTKEIGKGTGLGLSISYGIIEKHGGKIEAISQEGKGSTFIVCLPK
ncbi:MAG: hypothetical protein A3C35_02985 [Omnitrophica bacterium RIFCSPHIGHO2_02_FULL_46_11]|nr:MAG: hypothetical protein A3C35_02985 [Omnitrophica bacterium RIFCSPHIGHO2_02_FULL_46_11]OGW84883.1 MAG: hypothetical protein A3A81_01020 [Omnitrophica bacterium RIFCSPLOWO2_01_FULL_45_10b]